MVREESEKVNTMKGFLFAILIMSMSAKVSAQSKSNYIRIAKLTIDSVQLESYKTALKEHAESAVKVEPGVLMLYAVYDKDQPVNVTVFEIYASTEAYKSHILTPHFLKYKETVKDMVKSLKLVDVVPIALEAKNKILN